MSRGETPQISLSAPLVSIVSCLSQKEAQSYHWASLLFVIFIFLVVIRKKDMAHKFHPNSAKHKAQHGGYKQKPTQQQVRANLDFWAGMTDKPIIEINSKSSGAGRQLKMNF